MNKKILVVSPSLPFPVSGAEQADRARGFQLLKELGFEVRSVVKLVAWHSQEWVSDIEKKLGIKIIPVSYKYSNTDKKLNFREKLKKNIKKFSNPLFLDGAAFEFSEPEIQFAVKNEIENWKPDFVWFDYTYLWPLYKFAKKKGIPVITRSVNFEPIHFLEEDGFTIFNFLKAIPKLISEFKITKNSDLVFSISPKEAGIYRKMGAKNVINLPLRSLPYLIKNSREIENKGKLNVFFLGSSYNVSHNKKALKFVIKEIIPEIEKRQPENFTFHILGSKLPKGLDKYFSETVLYQGYVEDLEQFLEGMDISLAPSLAGAGMQQKIFEPLVRGIPTIASERGITGYPFKNEEHLLFAKTKEEFADCVIGLQDQALRKKLSENSIRLSQKLFSRETIASTILKGIKELEK